MNLVDDASGNVVSLKIRDLLVKKAHSSLPPLLFKSRDRRQCPKLLEGLGRATRRGVRACPNCGIINGTRGLKCKNGSCRFVFNKKTSENGAMSSENVVEEEISESELRKSFRALRLIGREKFYSVQKICQSKGDLTDWGFVHLPSCVNSHQSKDLVAYHITAFCYMKDCTMSVFHDAPNRKNQQSRKRANESVSCIDRDFTDGAFPLKTCCQHVKAAFSAEVTISCTLPVDSNLLDSVSLPKEAKVQLTRLVCMGTKDDPLVQRISNRVYVVRGMKDNVHAENYTYVFFEENETGNSEGKVKSEFFVKEEDEEEEEIQSGACLTCWCGLKLNLEFFKESTYQPCLQLFACLLALSSTHEFAQICFSLLSATDEYYKQVNLVQENLMSHGPHFSSAADIIKGEHGEAEECGGDDEGTSRMEMTADELDKEVFGLLCQSPVKKERKSVDVSPGGTKKQHRTSGSPKKQSQTSDSGHAAVEENFLVPSVLKASGNTSSVVGFEDWMNFVIEAIGDTMHYEAPGKPLPLKFYVPDHFFDVVLSRISKTSSSKKRRLPDASEIIRVAPPQPPPYGQFGKYVWHLHSPGHVQEIFSTSTSKLELSRNFAENHDGTVEKLQITNEKSPKYDSSGRRCIQPFHPRTRLKIGQSADNNSSSDVTPFTIQWIPDLYRQCKVGEMTLKFEFDHYRGDKLILPVE